MNTGQVQIGLFGKRSSGKSALLNVLLGQDASAVSQTTEPVYKAMEISGVGLITIVDTAGIDSSASNQTKAAADKADVALMLIANDSLELELAWINRLSRAGARVIPIISQIDKLPDQGKSLAAAVHEACGIKPLRVSATQNIGIDQLRNTIKNSIEI